MLTLEEPTSWDKMNSANIFTSVSCGQLIMILNIIFLMFKNSLTLHLFSDFT